jgi:hypothetical protein
VYSVAWNFHTQPICRKEGGRKEVGLGFQTRRKVELHLMRLGFQLTENRGRTAYIGTEKIRSSIQPGGARRSGRVNLSGEMEIDRRRRGLIGATGLSSETACCGGSLWSGRTPGRVRVGRVRVGRVRVNTWPEVPDVDGGAEDDEDEDKSCEACLCVFLST